jgi:hypothetical protein
MAKPKKFVVGGLLNLGYGLATAGASYAQRQKALRQMAQLDQSEQGIVMSEAARRRVARQETDAQMALDQAARSSASSLAAAQEAGGSRAVSAINPSVARAQEEATARALQAFGSYGAQMSQQQDSDLLNISRSRIGQERGALRAAADAATQNMVSGLGMAAGGFAETLGSLPKLGKKDKTEGTESNLGTRSLGTQLNFPNVKKPAPLFGAAEVSEYEAPAGNIVLDEVAVTPKPRMAQGGKAIKTPGAFSHKTNPIDVMKDGKKIAEMTGGEYIFNPKQSEQMRNLSKQGNSALHKFVRDLLSKRQFK